MFIFFKVKNTPVTEIITQVMANVYFYMHSVSWWATHMHSKQVPLAALNV